MAHYELISYWDAQEGENPDDCYVIVETSTDLQFMMAERDARLHSDPTARVDIREVIMPTEKDNTFLYLMYHNRVVIAVSDDLEKLREMWLKLLLPVRIDRLEKNRCYIDGDEYHEIFWDNNDGVPFMEKFDY